MKKTNIMPEEITRRISAFPRQTKQLLGRLDHSAIAAARQILLESPRERHAGTS